MSLPSGVDLVDDASNSWHDAAMKMRRTLRLSATAKTVTERKSGGITNLEWREESHDYRLPEDWDLERLQDLLTSNGFAPPDAHVDTSPGWGKQSPD